MEEKKEISSTDKEMDNDHKQSVQESDSKSRKISSLQESEIKDEKPIAKNPIVNILQYNILI